MRQERHNYRRVGSKDIRSNARGLSVDKLGRHRVHRGEDEKKFTVRREEITVPDADPFREHSYYEVERVLGYRCSYDDGWEYNVKNPNPERLRIKFAKHVRAVPHNDQPELMKVVLAYISDNARLPVHGYDQGEYDDEIDD